MPMGIGAQPVRIISATCISIEQVLVSPMRAVLRRGRNGPARLGGACRSEGAAHARTSLRTIFHCFQVRRRQRGRRAHERQGQELLHCRCRGRRGRPRRRRLSAPAGCARPSCRRLQQLCTLAGRSKGPRLQRRALDEPAGLLLESGSWWKCDTRCDVLAAQPYPNPLLWPGKPAVRLVKAGIPSCSANGHGGRTGSSAQRANGAAPPRLRVGIVLSGGQAPGARLQGRIRACGCIRMHRGRVRASTKVLLEDSRCCWCSTGDAPHLQRRMSPLSCPHASGPGHARRCGPRSSPRAA